jgi:endonuclease/exonuclease/phosphatase (EEP) superfamily protein YafD
MRGPGRASLIYPAALLALIALFRLVGERWWPVCFLLYLPRAPLGLPLIFFGWRLWRRGPRWLLLGQAVALLLWAFPLMGFILPGRPRPGVGPALRVLSYNVDHAYAGPELVVAEIARFAPDVVLNGRRVDKNPHRGVDLTRLETSLRVRGHQRCASCCCSRAIPRPRRAWCPTPG